LIEGNKEHCLAHGRELLRKMLILSKYQLAKEQVGVTSGVKRVRGLNLPFIVVKAPEEQSILIREIEPDATSAWRAGFNKRPLSLEAKMVALLHKELCDHAFALSKDSAGVLSLITLKARREGEVLCPLRGLLFDTLSSLEGFLSEGGNKVLADRVVRVVLDEAGGVSPVYMAVTGIGGVLRPFAGVRKNGPNAITHVDCSKGAGDGFLSLTVSTTNQTGIAARSVLS